MSLGQAGRAAHQLLRGPDEPGVVRPAVAAQAEGVHARVAEHRRRFRVGHVQRARGHPGGEQVPDDQGGGGGIGPGRVRVVEQDLVQVVQLPVAAIREQRERDDLLTTRDY